MPREPLDLDAIEARAKRANRVCYRIDEECEELATHRCEAHDCGVRFCEEHAKQHERETWHDFSPLGDLTHECVALVAAVRERDATIADLRARLASMSLANDLAINDELLAAGWRPIGAPSLWTHPRAEGQFTTHAAIEYTRCVFDEANDDCTPDYLDPETT